MMNLSIYIMMSVMLCSGSLLYAQKDKVIFRDVLTYKEKKHLITVQQDKLHLLPVKPGELTTPFRVSIYPIGESGTADYQKEIILGFLPQAKPNHEPEILGCLHGNKYLFVFNAVLSSDNGICMKSFTIDKPYKEKVIRGTKKTADGKEREVVYTDGVGMPDFFELKWSEDHGGKKIDNIKLLKLFLKNKNTPAIDTPFPVDKASPVDMAFASETTFILIGADLDAKERLFVSEMKAGRWQKCRPFLSDSTKR